MYVEKGCAVILASTDQTTLSQFIGTQWEVLSVLEAYHPACAIIKRNNIQISASLRDLEVIPPATSPLRHNELVKIQKEFIKNPNAPHYCNTSLLGKIGHIRGYDLRNDYYKVITSTGSGWFPIECLVPTSFKGETFYYPMQIVSYKKEKCTVMQVKTTRFNHGQLLLIDGVWVPSSHVEKV